MSAPNEIVFPCAEAPADPARARLLGLYPQRQPGLLMQRVKVLGGVISAAQLRAVSESSARHAPGWPLHLTTRQDIEIHGLTPDRVPLVQGELHAVGLTTVGACGDTLRNVTVCPGLCTGAHDVLPLAAELARVGDAMPMIRSLPRKFKVSLSACPKACARPWINDLGLVAQPDGRFRAVVGGSLGPKPATGIGLDRIFEAHETVALLRAAIRLFDAEGDRVNRSRARLRHLRERLGDQEFIARLNALLAEELAGTPFRDVAVPPAKPVALQSQLRFPLGNIDTADAVALADAAEASGTAIRIGFDHDVLLFGATRPALPLSLVARGEAPAVVACPGAAWCSRGIVDTHEPAREIERSLVRDFGGVVSLSGCPNGCAQSGVSEIGLSGCIKTIDGERRQCFRIVVGGQAGRGPALAQEIHPGLDASLVPLAVRAVVQEFSARKPHEPARFSSFVGARVEELKRTVAGIESRRE